MTQPSSSDTEQSSFRRCFLLLVDGLRADVAEEEFIGGRLPHLAQLIHPSGRATAVTAFPSTTSVARDWVVSHKLESQYPLYLRNSLKLQQSGRKFQIERARACAER